MSDYFNQVGQKVCAMLANDPAARQRLRQFADGALSRHTAGPMAKDAALPIAGKVRRNFGARDQDPSLEPRGGQNYPDPNDGPVTAEECISAIQLMLRSLTGPDRDALIGALHELLTEEPMETANGTNAAALDYAPRSGARTGRDSRQALDRRIAMDRRSAASMRAHNDFLARFPDAGRITNMGIR